MNSTLYNTETNVLPLSPHIFIWTLNVHLQLQCIFPFPPVKPAQNMKYLVPCDKSHLSLKPNWSVASCLQFVCLRYIYFLRLIFLYYCPMPYLLFLFLRTSFWVVHVPANSIFWTFIFRTICNPVILEPTPKMRICIYIVTFSTFIFWIPWIKRWTEFLIYLSFYLQLKKFQLVGSSTMTAHWAIKICGLYSSYLIIQIEGIYL